MADDCLHIGILALQGNVIAHASHLQALGARVHEIRRPGQLNDLDGLILPGGESTTMLHFLQQDGFWAELQHFASHKPCFGTCAGAILLAREVQNPAQISLGALDITIERNAWGSQRESRIRSIALADDIHTLEAVYIRAPRIIRTGSAVEIMAMDQNDPIWVRQGLSMATTFHPELTADLQVHAEFLRGIRSQMSSPPGHP